jgi:hypothetical protein
MNKHKKKLLKDKKTFFSFQQIRRILRLLLILHGTKRPEIFLEENFFQITISLVFPKTATSLGDYFEMMFY